MIELERLRIHYFGTVTSTLDKGFELAAEGSLSDWESVVARAQTAGRGQTRRKWVSLDKNLFAAIRLPKAAPFDTLAAAVATATLLTAALRGLGYHVNLKWPNDVVILKGGKPCKCCGLLVEDKMGCSIAGIGINLHTSPGKAELDREESLEAASLADLGRPAQLPEAPALWQEVIRQFARLYSPTFADTWTGLAEDFLAWRGERVVVSDSSQSHEGILLGLDGKGGAVLRSGSGTSPVYSGTMRKA